VLVPNLAIQPRIGLLRRELLPHSVPPRLQLGPHGEDCGHSEVVRIGYKGEMTRLAMAFGIHRSLLRNALHGLSVDEDERKARRWRHKSAVQAEIRTRNRS